MARTIVKVEPEWNNSHCSLTGVDHDLPGWSVLPEKFRKVWEESNSFVTITTNDKGEITGMEICEEIKADEDDRPGMPVEE